MDSRTSPSQPPQTKSKELPASGFEDYDLTQDEEFLELVRIWHRLKPSIRGAIMILARRGARDSS